MHKRSVGESSSANLDHKFVHGPLFQNDFILLAEFCEQRGPVPLLVIPEKGSGRFDLSRFVVRILSSDHTRKNDPNKGGSGWMTPEDTQIYLTDASQGAHAYVQHLTLHDIHARGYVRPFCICYITHERDKIMNNFESLLNAFTQISQVLKYGNNCRFVRDIKKQLSGISRIGIYQHLKRQNDTRQAQTRFTDDKSDDEDNDKEQTDVKAIDFLQEFPELTSDVFKEVLRDLHDLKNKFLLHMENRGQKLDRNILEHIQTTMLSSSPQIFSALHNSPRVANRSMARQIYKTPPRNTMSSSYNSSAMSFSNPEFFSLYDGGLSASSPNLQKYMPTVLKCIHKNTNFEEKLRDISQITGGLFETAHDMIYHILEHFHRPSLVLDMERFDLTHLNLSQDLSSMLFIGKSFILDFNMENDHCFIPTHNQYWSAISSTSPSSNNSSIHSNDSNSSTTEVNNEKYVVYRNGFKGNGCYVSTIFDTSGTELHKSFEKWKKHRSNSLKGNTPTQDPPQPSNALITSMLTEMKNTSANVDIIPGRGVLALRHFSFAKDMIYALMTGRPLVIQGLPENEHLVKNLVVTCSLFVPGLLTSYQQSDDESNNGPQICTWRTKPLSLLDLTRYKLIGMSKRVSISKSFESMITRLDLEEQTLYTNIQYKGTFLNQIFDREKRWPDEATYIAYIHSVFADMGTKAALLYHQHSIQGIKNQNLTRYRFLSSKAVIIEKTPPTPQVSSGQTFTNTSPTTPQKNESLIFSEPTVSSNVSPALPPVSPIPPATPNIVMGVQFNLPPRRISNGTVPPTQSLSPTQRRVTQRKKGTSALKRKAPSLLNIISASSPSNNVTSQLCVHDIETVRDCLKPYIKQLGLRHHDANIIDHLADIVKQQQYNHLTCAPSPLILENNVNCTITAIKNVRMG